MSAGATPVPRNSAAYREFARLYYLAQSLRPNGVDRWNGDLYATDSDRWGGFDPKTGRITVSGDLVLHHLTGPGRSTAPERQAEALATVLHEATHTGMPTDAPDEPNAVRSAHSLGLMEGIAEARTLADFPVFAARAGYSGLELPKAAYPAAHAAAADLMRQASGPRKPRGELIADAARGPAAMHFDQLADGVLRNRLHDVVPDRAEDRLAVRAALIETMVHDGWIVLTKLKDVGTGEQVARDIRGKLDAKVDEIRQHYRATPGRVFPAEGANAEVVRVAEGNKLEALPPPDAGTRVERPVRGRQTPSPVAVQASDGNDGRGPGGATETRGSGNEPGAQGSGGGREVQGSGSGPDSRDPGKRPGAPGSGHGEAQGSGRRSEVPGSGGGPEVLGSGGRPEVAGSGARPEVAGSGARPEVAGSGARPEVAGSGARPEVAGSGARPEVPGPGGEPELPGAGNRSEAPGADGLPDVPGPGGGPEVPGSGGGPEVPGSDGRAEAQRAGGEGKERATGGGDGMRFLEGQAPAAGAVGWRPRLGQGGRGAGRGDVGGRDRGLGVDRVAGGVED
jgi:hypothetical protein